MFILHIMVILLIHEPEYDGAMESSSNFKKPLNVTQLNRHVRNLLEKDMGVFWLEAEVSEATAARSGHVYFKVTDPGGGAQVDAVMWRGQAARFGTLIVKGAKLLLSGRVTLYEAGGRYQFIANRVEEAGAGLKAKRLRELKAKLKVEGLFAAERKRPLPPFPQCVGVVTSRSGAALQDIIKVMSRRFPCRLVLSHAQVQGEGADTEVVTALNKLVQYPGIDVIIVGRGGGSTEDLDVFNSEAIVRAIAASTVPVISAVGHEVDITLADLSADHRAATPSEAAELAVPEKEQLETLFSDTRFTLKMIMQSRLGKNREQLTFQTGKLRTQDPRIRLRKGLELLSHSREIIAKWPSHRMNAEKNKLDQLTERLHRWPELALARAQSDLTGASQGLFQWPKPALSRAQNELTLASQGVYQWPKPVMADARGRLGQLAGQLHALSPLASLDRGYAIVQKVVQEQTLRTEDKQPYQYQVVTDAAQVNTGAALKITLARGTLDATVTHAYNSKNETK